MLYTRVCRCRQGVATITDAEFEHLSADHKEKLRDLRSLPLALEEFKVSVGVRQSTFLCAARLVRDTDDARHRGSADTT